KDVVFCSALLSVSRQTPGPRVLMRFLEISAVPCYAQPVAGHRGGPDLAMVTTSQSSVRDAAAAPGRAAQYTLSRLVALPAMAASGIGCLLTCTSAAQQSPEIVENIGDAYQIGRMRVNGGMVVQTILYNGRPIATGVMLPGRAEVTSAGSTSTP